MAECARAYPEEVTDAFVRQTTMEDIATVSKVDSLPRVIFFRHQHYATRSILPNQGREQDPENDSQCPCWTIV